MARIGYTAPPAQRMKRSIPPQMRGGSAQPLHSATSNNFDGGLNTVDNELEINSKFARVLKNMWRNNHGEMALRFGTTLFADIADAGLSSIIGMEYFATFIVAVDKLGQVALIQGDGSVGVVWSAAIAASRKVAAWHSCSYVTFAQLKNSIAICNGIDKPLLIANNGACNYMVDLGTLLNTNTPVAKYCFAHQRFLIMAGDINHPDRLYIGARDTMGTFFGDPPPNDGVNVDLASFISGDSTITGLNAFREFLVITFPNATIIAKLGSYTGSVHVPAIDDPIQEIGCVSHKSMSFLGDDLFFLDTSGAQSLKRALITGKLEPKPISDNVLPNLSEAMAKIPLFSDDATAPFALYHHNDDLWMLFVPNATTNETITESRGFVLRFSPEQGLGAWCEFRNWNWRSACKSLLGDIFFSRGSRIFLYGSDNDGNFADYVGEQEAYSDGTVHTDGMGFSPISDGADGGVPIDFVWELPWSSFKQRMHIKKIKHVQADTLGEGAFTLKLFVDNFYYALDFGEPFTDGTLFTDNLGFVREDAILDPAVEIEMVGGEAKGYGYGPYGYMPYGSGRLATEERLYGLPVKGKLIKIRIDGSSMEKIAFSSLTINYTMGGIRR